MKKLLPIFALISIICSAQPAFALLNNYNYISAEAVKTKLADKAAMTLIDIQVKDEFNQHHIIGAVPTYAYPVKTPSDQAKLSSSIEALKNNQDLAVIVCPRGGGGAKRAYDHLLESGIAETRLVILTNGQAKWPFTELLAAPK